MSPEPRHGFSLLEVLLATVLLGLGLTVFFSAANQGVTFAGKARDYEVYRHFLRELHLREPMEMDALETGEDSGSFRDEEEGVWFWRRTLTPIDEDGEELFHVRTEVWREGQEAGSGEAVETFIYQPDAQQPGWVREPVDEL
jgi:prepilin-type N-terminal cleavage/methylation domain-containing protein